MTPPAFLGAPLRLVDDPARRATALARVTAFVREVRPRTRSPEALRAAMARGDLDAVLAVVLGGTETAEGFVEALAPALEDHGWVALWQPWGAVERLYVLRGAVVRQSATVALVWEAQGDARDAGFTLHPQNPVVSTPDAARL